MGLEGFAGGGKSLTASQIAIGIHKLIKSTKPIAVIDTEAGIKSLTDLFDAEGIEVQIEEEERSLTFLSQTITKCEQGFADILIVESITTIWEEFKLSYMRSKRRNNNFLEFQDWNILKPKWRQEFSEKFVRAGCHIIFTGRAGYEYGDTLNEDTGKREIYKTGIKMKSEAETAFEPDMVVLMQSAQETLSDKKKFWNEAVVIKDRSRVLNGQTFRYNQGDEKKVFNDFYPAIKKFLDGTLKELHGPTMPDSFAEFESKYSELGKERAIMIAEIEGCFELMGFGNGADDKQKKTWILNQIYGVNSIEGLAKKNNTTLRQGLEILKNFSNDYKKYLNTCLDNEQPIEKGKVSQMMKALLNEPVK